MTEHSSRGWLGVYRAIAFVVIGLGACAIAFGCKDVATTWLTELRSPDGRWLAIAKSEQGGGPGTAYDATTVYLKPVNGSQAQTETLLFSHQYATMNLKMDWLSPNHLDVAYGPSTRPGDSVTLDFQVVKMAGVDISVRALQPPGS